MPTPHTHSHHVLIAGAGPVGLFLACELRLAGCTVLVLEQMREPRTPLKELPFGLRGLTVPTIESLDRRGLLDALKERSADRNGPASAHWMQQARRPAGHFAGIQFFHDQIDSGQWPYRLPGGVSNLAKDMASIESVLAARAGELGAEILRGCGVENFEETPDGVVVFAGGRSFQTRWLVGCDGGRSTVRKIAGIGFTGTEPEFTGYSAQVKLADPDLLKPGRHYTATGMYTFAAPGTLGMVDFDGGAFHRSGPVSREHIEAVLCKVSGASVRVMELELVTTWTDRAYLATEYRKGRVLLAGDAAHIHSPLGGQGLNLGLGDAMNLGWKLAATVHGSAPIGLLDTYSRERQPEAARVLDWSRAQVALMRPSPSSRALEAVIRDLVQTRDGATYFAERVWGVGICYDLGDAHPLVGRSAPDFELADGSSLNSRLRTGLGCLLDFEGRKELQSLARRWHDRVRYIGSDTRDRLGLGAVLIRPDGIVAWAKSDGGRIDDDCALAQWFGEPTRPGP